MRDRQISGSQITAYEGYLRAEERSPGTIEKYLRDVRAFARWLDGRPVTKELAAGWKEHLLGQGYAPVTINAMLTAVNRFFIFAGWEACRVKFLKIQRRLFRDDSRELTCPEYDRLLAHMDRRDLQLVDRLELRPEIQPELTWAEYLRLLGAARALDRERTYLLVKLFALTGLRVGEVPRVTVAAVESGRMKAAGPGGKTGYRPIPTCLREELRSYLRRTGVSAGQVFVTRNGRPVRRTQISMEIRSLSQPARVTEEKCNPRCLRKLYQATQAEIDRSVRLLAEQAWDRMMENEQLTVGWDAEEGVRDV